MTARKMPAAPRVLVVDDYEDTRELFAEYLAMAGYEVELARNGAEALELARRSQPQVILMDLSLPVMDGWEASRRLKDDPRTRDAKIIALTGHRLDRAAEGVLRAGCDAFLIKPVAPQDVLAKIEEVLGARISSAPIAR